MRTRLVGVIAMILWMPPSRVTAAVNLELRPEPQTVAVGALVDVALFAVSDDGADQTFSAMDVVLTWDPTALELIEALSNGPHNWNFMFGFVPDGQLDGLNDSLLDGDALFQAASLTSATATAEGLLVTTLQFQALSPGTAGVFIVQSAECAPRDKQCLSGDNFGALCVEDSECGERVCLGDPSAGNLCNSDFDCPDSICPVLCSACEPQFCCTTESNCSICSFAETRVLQPGNIDVTGTLGSASVTIVGPPSLSASDVNMPAGRTAEVVVFGAIAGESTFGVEILVEIVSRPENSGTVTFTLPPPVDIVQADDPWPGAGMFTPFDTDSPGFFETLNGSVDDDGRFLCDAMATVSFSGPLSAFPVTASADTMGVWDVVLFTSAGASSWWECVPTTTLIAGTLQIVDLGDGDGGGAIDLRDFSELQVCFTGSVGPVDPPAYPLTPELRCIVYDFDDDGDVDNDDLAAFLTVMFGPAP